MSLLDTWVFRIAGFVTILSGAAAFVVWFVNWFQQRSAILVAHGEYANFSVPRPIQQAIQTLLDALNPQQMRMYLAGDWTDSQRMEAAMSLYRFLETKIDEKLRRRLEGFSSVWEFAIANRGSRELTDLFIESDLEGVFVIRRDGTEAEGGAFARRIPLGALRGGSAVTVHVWAWYGTGSIWREEKIRVTHPHGTVRVRFPRRVWFVPGWLARLFSRRPATWG